MPKAIVTGLEENIKKLETLEKRMQGRAIKEIIEAGSGEAVGGLRSVVARSRHVQTGGMMNSIRGNGVQLFVDGGYEVIDLQGRAPNGITQHDKAFIIDTGVGRQPTTKRGLPNKTGDRFISDEWDAMTPRIQAAMKKKMEDILAESGLT